MKRALVLAVGLGTLLLGSGLQASASEPQQDHKVCVVFPTGPDDTNPEGYCIWFGL